MPPEPYWRRITAARVWALDSDWRIAATLVRDGAEWLAYWRPTVRPSAPPCCRGGLRDCKAEVRRLLRMEARDAK